MLAHIWKVDRSVAMYDYMSKLSLKFEKVLPDIE